MGWFSRDFLFQFIEIGSPIHLCWMDDTFGIDRNERIYNRRTWTDIGDHRFVEDVNIDIFSVQRLIN